VARRAGAARPPRRGALPPPGAAMEVPAAVSPAPQVAMPGLKDMSAQTWGEYWNENASLYILLLVVAACMLSIAHFEREWQRWQNRLARATGIKQQGQAYSMALVRHFVPSFTCQRYQFRGMMRNAKSIDIAFEDLALEVEGGPQVLKGVSGKFFSGRLSAIMGPSGAGKTSFMNVLCGKATYGKISGQIAINNRKADMRDLRDVVGFVPQDDIVFEDLTVREQIDFSARLRNDRRLSPKRVRHIVDDILSIMQLEHIQKSIVGGVSQRGISGGQRKRVNIGLELAAQPSVLFLDEPTSGLDSTSSLSVAASLKRMGSLGMSSIMVIHQPRYSLFTLIDDVLLLGKGGQTVFLGPATCVKEYFESLGFTMPEFENPADWFMDVISGDVKNSIIPQFKPEMLFGLWVKHKNEVSSLPSFRVAASRELNDLDVHAVIHEALDKEWDSIDTSRNGILEESELQELLAQCSAVIPDADVVRDLVGRMAGEGAMAVSKSEFLSYLCSLGEEIAQDVGLSPAPDFATPSRDNDETSESSSESGSEYSSEARACRSHSLSVGKQRQIPTMREQLATLMMRRMVQWWRMIKQRLLFLGALMFGATCFSVMDRYLAPQTLWDATPLLYLHTALALLCSIFCLPVFGHNQPLFWRERARGINIFAYFLARVIITLLDLTLMTFVFTSWYYIIRQPIVPYWHWMLPFLFSAFGASGWGYLVSNLVAPEHGPFVMTLVTFTKDAICGNFTTLLAVMDGGAAETVIGLLSLTRWTVQMSFTYVVGAMNPQPGQNDRVLASAQVVKEQVQLQMEKEVYFHCEWGNLGFWWTPAMAVLRNSVILYALSYIALLLRNRKKQV